MTSKEAISILNKYRNSFYNSSVKEEVKLAMAIDKVLPHYIKLDEKNTPKKPDDFVLVNKSEVDQDE